MKINLFEKGSVYLTESQSRYYRYKLKGYGVRETARICGVSAATVSKTLKTVEKKIQKMYHATDGALYRDTDSIIVGEWGLNDNEQG